MAYPSLPAEAERSLRWPLRLTAAGMVVERLWQAFWPLVSVLLAGLAAVVTGLGGVVAPLWIWAGVGVLAVVALGWGLRRVCWPERGAVLARLDATLDGQPIAALLDDQATGSADAGARGVWAAHRARMTARLRGARAVAPDLRVAGADPFGLRLMALIAAVMALGFGAWPPGPWGALPGGARPSAALLASWEGWIEPPAYTGQPSLYLNDQPAGDLSVPFGSRVTLRFYGQEGALALAEEVSGGTLPPPGSSAEFDVIRDGVLVITGPGGRGWRVTAIGDAPPTVRPDGPVVRALDGGMRQGFVATDDHGVQSGQAMFTLDLEAVDRRHGLTAAPEPRDPIVVDLPMPFRGNRQELREILHENFKRHPWADMPVRMVLSVQDGAGQQAQGAAQMILPGRRFLTPLARALVEQRRDLLWTRTNAPRVAQVLRAISHRPDDGLFPGAGAYLKLRQVIRQLEAAMVPALSPRDRDDLAQVLWDMAEAIEGGGLEDALARLQRAQERLAEAMRQGASPEELAELMQELREAMRDYMARLAQQAPDGTAQPGDDTMTLTPDDLAKMMARIEQLMREGRTDEAMAALEMLRQLMENMQATRGQQGPPEPGDQAMQGLQDTLRDQQGLSDETFRDAQEQGQQDGGGGDSGDLAGRQQRLRDQLDSQRRALPGAGGETGEAAREALDQAGEAMEGAEQALRGGDIDEALDRQAEAMEALREGMRSLEEALQSEQAARQGQQGGVTDTPDTPGQRRDPLGRDMGTGTRNLDRGPLAEGDDAYRRAEELMNDIRRRSGEGDRPQFELDYLKRLLDQF